MPYAKKKPGRKRSSSSTTRYLPPLPADSGGGGHHRSFVHWLSNASKGIYGIPAGIYKAGETVSKDIYHNPKLLALPASFVPTAAYMIAKGKNPAPRTYKDLVKPTGVAYKQKYYDTLRHGDVGGLLHEAFVKDPIGTAMDLATLGTLGEAGLVRGAGLLGKSGGRFAPAGRAYTLRAGEGVHEVGIGGKTGLSRRLRLVADAAAKRATSGNGRFSKGLGRVAGEDIRYARAISIAEKRRGLAYKFSAIPYWKAWKKLNPAEKVAANLMHDYPSASLLDQYKTNLRQLDPEKHPWIEKRLAEIEDPKVQAAFEEGLDNPNIKHFLDESEKLGEISRLIGGTNEATAKQRRYQQALIMRGAEFKINKDGLRAVKRTQKDADKLIRQSNKTIERFGKVQAGRDRIRPYSEEFLATRDELAAANDELARLMNEGNVVSSADVPPKHISKGMTEQEQLTELEFNALATQQQKVVDLATRYEELFGKHQYFGDLGERGNALLAEQALRNPELRKAVAAHTDNVRNASEITARIQQHADDLREGYSLFAKGDPHIPEGHTRLWRGLGEGEVSPHLHEEAYGEVLGDEEHYFSANRETAKMYDTGGGLLYVDVPKGMIHDWTTVSGEGLGPAENVMVPGTYAQHARRESSIENMIKDIQEELDAQGRPQPLYRKHATEIDDIESLYPGGGGGMSPDPRRVIFRSKGVNAKLGRVLQSVDTLTPQFLRVVRRELAVQRHTELVKMSRRSHTPNAKPGEVYLREFKSDKISHLDRTEAQFDRALTENLGKEIWSEAPETVRGQYLIIDKGIAKKIVGEYTPSNNAVLRFLTDATDVWRALVLNLRPAWLVNNMVGNTLLYSLSNAGPGGLRAYLNAIGPAKVGEILLDPATRKYVDPELMAEILPDHVAGVLARSQAPHLAEAEGTSLRHKFAGATEDRLGDSALKAGTRKGARGLGHALSSLRKADAWYEQRLRTATMGRAIMHNPEIKAVVDDMMKIAKDTPERMAAAQAARDTTEITRLSKEINRTLGDFTKMGDFEKGFVRRIIPFYAWYKAITKITLSLPIDNPYRTSILYHLGQIGSEYTAEYGNPPILGAIPLPGGRVLRTTGVNPLASVPDTARSFLTLGSGYSGAVPGTNIDQPSAAGLGFASSPLSPFVSALQTGGLSHTIRFLPEARLIAPPGSKTYADAGRLAELYSFLGIPIRRPASFNSPASNVPPNPNVRYLPPLP